MTVFETAFRDGRRARSGVASVKAMASENPRPNLQQKKVLAFRFFLTFFCKSSTSAVILLLHPVVKATSKSARREGTPHRHGKTYPCFCEGKFGFSCRSFYSSRSSRYIWSKFSRLKMHRHVISAQKARVDISIRY
jgi:hypothetical protein